MKPARVRWEAAHWRGTHWIRGHYVPEDVVRLSAAYDGALWSVFSCQWHQVGICAAIDSGQMVKWLTPKPGLQRTILKLIGV